MSDNYQLLTPIFIIISIGLIAYLFYVITLVSFGISLRSIENIIVISVIIITLVILIFLTKEGGKLQERLDRILGRRSLPEEEAIDRELPYHILRELEEIIKASKKGEPKEIPKEEIKVTEKPKERVELPKKKPEEKAKPPEREPEEEKEKIKIEKPAKPPEEIPKTVMEKLEEISRLLKEGAKLKDTDIEGTKKAFLRIREIYNSLSPEERKLIDREIAKAMSSRKKTAKKSLKEKK